MEDSALRIARILARGGDHLCTLYYRRYFDGMHDPNVNFVNLEALSALLLAPLKDDYLSDDSSERSSILQVVLRGCIEETIARGSAGRHIVISLFLTGAGFIAQQAADALSIDHVACVRGTDFSRDCHSPSRVGVAEYVLARATRVVTTNLEQACWARSHGLSAARVVTIYNSVCNEIRTGPSWTRRGRTGLRLVADCGMSHKKATGLLLTAVAEFASAHPAVDLHLELMGEMEPSQVGYWTNFWSHIASRMGGRARYLGRVSLMTVVDRLLASDLYCSATLGEGCSNGTNVALVLGIPILATRTGALPELAGSAPHITMASPGSVDSYSRALARALHNESEWNAPRWAADVKRWRDQLSEEREQRAWTELVQGILQQ